MNNIQLPYVEKVEDFPDVSLALSHPDGLLAYSNSLTSELLLYAYSHAIFPWYEDHQPVLWWSPSQRAVLFPDEIKLRKSLKQSFRKSAFSITLNQDFNKVIQRCATIKRSQQSETWITDEMIANYQNLHEHGTAHSVECWSNNKLVGGLYGIYSHGLFCGESMFSEATDASKCCLLALAQNSEAMGISLIDCQIQNPYLKSMGAKEISRNEFLKYFNINQAQLNTIPQTELTITL